MTPAEFRDEFDVFYNNVTSNQAPGLDAYEISVILKRAIDDVIKGYFNPRGNKIMEGYDDSDKRQMDFYSLNSVLTIDKQDIKYGDNDSFVGDRGFIVTVKSKDILLVVNEVAIASDAYVKQSKRLSVIPIKYEDYNLLTSKPFARPNKNQAWRILNADGSNKKIEVVLNPNWILDKYIIRYVRKPKPIIIPGITDNELIKGLVGDFETTPRYSDITENGYATDVDSILHYDILKRAVEIAKAAYIGDLGNQISLGQNSQTELGIPR